MSKLSYDEMRAITEPALTEEEEAVVEEAARAYLALLRHREGGSWPYETADMVISRLRPVDARWCRLSDLARLLAERWLDEDVEVPLPPRRDLERQPAPGHRISDEMVDEWVELADDGVTYTHIADDYDVAPSTVSRHVRARVRSRRKRANWRRIAGLQEGGGE